MFVDEKQQGEPQTAEQANRKLKLSEAIRIGCKKREQCRGGMWMQGRSCAMGAAYEGLTGDYGRVANDAYAFIEDKLGVPTAIIKEVVTRNDNLGFTREQIADWLESQGF